MDLADAILRARELQIQGQAEEALQLLLSAAEEHEDEDLWFEIATFYAERALNRPDALALADFAEADKWAELPITLAGKACILARRGELVEAETLTTQVLEMDPEYWVAHLALGELRFRQGRRPEAAEALAKAIDLHPAFAEAYLKLAEVLIAEGKKDFAQQVLTDARKKCEWNDRLLVALSELYVEEADYAKARRALEQATTQNAENAEAWRRLAWLAARDDNETRMREALERAASLDRDATLAWVAREGEQLPALKTFVT